MALTQCPDCGQEVSSVAESCPNCGRPWPARQLPTQVSPPGTNGYAITALVMGIASLLCLAPFGVGAVIFGPMAISQLNRRQERGLPEQKGRGMALTGTTLGVLGLIFFAVSMYFVFTDVG